MTGQLHLHSEWLAVTQRPQSYWLKSVLKRKAKKRRLTATLKIFTGIALFSGMKSPDFSIAGLICFITFRAIDGECNNVVHTSWGASSTPFNRIVAPHYADGHGSPRGGWESAYEPGTMTGNSRVTLPCNRSADAMLPNPRRVSKEMHRDESHPETRVRI